MAQLTSRVFVAAARPTPAVDCVSTYFQAVARHFRRLERMA